MAQDSDSYSHYWECSQESESFPPNGIQSLHSPLSPSEWQKGHQCGYQSWESQHVLTSVFYEINISYRQTHHFHLLLHRQLYFRIHRLARNNALDFRLKATVPFAPVIYRYHDTIDCLFVTTLKQLEPYRDELENRSVDPPAYLTASQLKERLQVAVVTVWQVCSSSEGNS